MLSFLFWPRTNFRWGPNVMACNGSIPYVISRKINLAFDLRRSLFISAGTGYFSCSPFSISTSTLRPGNRL
jgi:hypothetical protein